MNGLLQHGCKGLKYEWFTTAWLQRFKNYNLWRAISPFVKCNVFRYTYSFLAISKKFPFA